MNEVTDDQDRDDAAADAEKELIEAIRDRLPEGPVTPAVLAETLASILTVEVRRLVHFQGPLPPPEMLQQYEAVHKGLAEKIIERADKEQAFRHEMGRQQASLRHRSLTHTAGQGYIGQTCAFFIAMSSIAGGVYLISQGNDAQGLAAILVPIGGIAVAFIAGKIVEWKQRAPADDPTDDSE